MDTQQTSRLDQILSHRVSVEDQITEIAAEMDRLQDRLSRLPGALSANIIATVKVAGPENVEQSGVKYPLRYTGSDSRIHTSGWVAGVNVRCEQRDHDLTAENAPGECAATTFADGAGRPAVRHYFWKMSEGPDDVQDIWTRVVEARS